MGSASLQQTVDNLNGEPGTDGVTKRAYSGARREEQKLATQTRILDGALDLFSSRGFEGTSVRDIAASANVSHAVIRLHFGSKAQLWKRAVDYLFDRVVDEMRPQPGEPDFEDGAAGIACFVRQYVRYCARHPEHARLMLLEAMHDNEQLQYAVDKHIAPSHKFLERLLAPAMANGIVPAIPIVNLIYIVAAAGQSVFALAREAQLIYGMDVLDASFVESHADAVTRLLLGP